jgi:hypothetical protein
MRDRLGKNGFLDWIWVLDDTRLEVGLCGMLTHREYTMNLGDQASKFSSCSSRSDLNNKAGNYDRSVILSPGVYHLSDNTDSSASCCCENSAHGGKPGERSRLPDRKLRQFGLGCNSFHSRRSPFPCIRLWRPGRTHGGADQSHPCAQIMKKNRFPETASIGLSRSPCGSGEISEYEILVKFLCLVKEGVLSRVEHTFSIGTANDPSRSGTSATGVCQTPPCCFRESNRKNSYGAR